MPGRLLISQSASREAGKTMGVYKPTFPGSSAAGPESRLGSETTGSGFGNASMGRRYHNVEHSNSAQQSHVRVSSSLEAPEMEHFAAISEDDVLLQSSDSESRLTGTRTSNFMTTDDDSMLMEFTRRGRTSDDDSSFMDFPNRSSMSQDVDFAAQQRARHSTACCSDLAFRRELRKRFYVEPTVDENGMRRDITSSFTLGNSFRRELEKPEDRVESLALWEEITDHGRPEPASARNSSSNNVVAASNAAPHSWHADTAASSRTSARNKGLDAILRKKKSSFFNGFFSGLSFSSSRKSRKSPS